MEIACDIVTVINVPDRPRVHLDLDTGTCSILLSIIIRKKNEITCVTGNQD